MINKTKPDFRSTSHLNYMQGASYDINNPLLRLQTAAASCFMGEPAYYIKDPSDKRKEKAAKKSSHIPAAQLDYLRETLNAIDPREWRSMTPTQIMERSIDEALDYDPEKTLQLAAELRNRDHIRTTPQVILVRAAHHPKAKKTGLVRKYGPQIIKRADEPAVGLAYHLQTYGDKAPIPMNLRKAYKDFLEKQTEYNLAKYRMESRVVKTVDVVNLVHPKSDAVNKLVRGELKNTGETWEAIISEKGSTKEAWEEAIGHCGHMALIRNLRNLIDKEVPPDKFIGKLVETAKGGKQLPFRYYSAYTAVKDKATKKILQAIDDCLQISIVDNLPKFAGKTMSLVDNSGSAQGAHISAMGTTSIATIGNLSGVLAALSSDEGEVGVFGDKLHTMKISKNHTALENLEKVGKLANNIGQGTEHGIWLFWDQAIQGKIHYDQVFVFSDMQAGHGGLYGFLAHANSYGLDFVFPGTHQSVDVPKLINKYRKEVNPDVQVFLVQIAGYTDTIVPEYFDKTYILGGWGDGLFNYAARMIELNHNQSKQPSFSQ